VGSGSVGTTQLAAGATLAPGGGTGAGGAAGTGGAGNASGAGVPVALTVNGNLTLAQGSTYAVGVNASGASDTVHVSGTAALGGATVSVQAAAGNWGTDTKYRILDAAGGVNGTFGAIASNLAFLASTLSYDANDAYLELSRNNTTFASVGSTRNEIAAGNGMATLGASSALQAALLPLDEGTARSALGQLAGDIHASLRSSLSEDSGFVRDAAVSRLRSAFGVGAAGASSLAADSAAGSAADSVTGSASPSTDSPHTDTQGGQALPSANGATVWSQTFGGWAHTQSDGNAASVSDATSGELVGVDAPLASGWRVGGLAGVSFTKLDGGPSSASTDSYHLGIYAGRQWEQLGLRVGAEYAWHSIDTTRAVAFGNFSNNLSGSYDANTAQVFGELGYRFEAGRIAFEPYVDLAYVNLHTEGFTESGGPAALNGAAQTNGTTLSTLGLRTSTNFAMGHGEAKVTAAVGWRHAYGSVATQADMRFAGGDVFEVGGLPIARDTATIDLGVDFTLARNISARVSYAGQIGAQYQQHAIQGRVSWAF
jgi:fibronectin-binding autotransporter adhesin